MDLNLNYVELRSTKLQFVQNFEVRSKVGNISTNEILSISDLVLP